MPAHASLNRIYRLVWSALHQTWVVASELARGRGKSNATPLLSAALLASLAAISAGVGAAPQGGQVVSGSGSISASGSAGQSTTTIKQTSDKLSINWQSFNVGKAETVNFVQPSASALAVNRIFDTQGSQILGKINANGQVWLINPNGVLFGKDAQINVGALVASTLNPDDASIGSARSNFSGSSTAGVVNLGQINAAQGGYVAMLGHSVSNQGSISAPGGTVAMGAGSAVSLNFAGSKLLGLEVTSNQVNALAENGGLIQADGGQVLLTAGARESLLASVVNNTGVIQARTVQEKDGKIILLGGMAAGKTNVKGTLDASAPSGGNGGFIETSAYTVNVSDSASITTASAQGKQGQWLIDPYDFYIAESGGNITGKALGEALKNNDVTIQTTDLGTSATNASATGGDWGNGDIFVNDTVTWSTGKTLTLKAWNNIYINSAINASGGTGGKLALLYGQSSEGGGTANYFVNAPVSLKAGANFSTKLGRTGTTIDYTVITSLGSVGDEGLESATNSLQGLGHSSRLSGNFFALGADIDAGYTSAWNNNSGFSPIGSDSPFTSIFDGLGHTITGLTINRPTSTSSVGLFSVVDTGGVVRNVGLVNASVIGRDQVGGLVGNNSGDISNSYVTASVGALGNAGGLVGVNYGSISNSYAAGDVSASDAYIGGLVGVNRGEIGNSYATASVSGQDHVGGLVGDNEGSIRDSYATGFVNTPGDSRGGLVGYNDYDAETTIANSIWDVHTTGQQYSDGGLGWSTEDMMSLASYTTGDGNPNWDFTNTWYMVDGATRPFLRSEWSTTVRNTHQLQLMAMKPGSSYTLANDLNLTADLANTSSMWKTGDGFSPIGSSTTPFTGSFDGQGHTITGLSINRPTTEHVGLFGFVGTGGVVQNVGLVNATVSGQNNVGGLVGNNSGIIRTSYAEGSVTASSDDDGNTFAGGLVGSNTGTIDESYATGSVAGTSLGVGGLVGQNSGLINNSSAYGSVDGGYEVGGLVGQNSGVISNSFSEASIFDSVSGSAHLGGLVGSNSGSITDSNAARIVSGSEDFIGGLVGSNSGSITNSHAKRSMSLSNVRQSDVRGSNAIGGLVGLNEGSISDSYAESYTSGTGGAIGGLVGYNLNSTNGIKRSYATGNVKGSSNVGGLVGSNENATIENTYATGKVEGTDNNVGGLVGYNNKGSISSSYATGLVTARADKNVGGFVGQHVRGTVGGIERGTISRSYFNKDTTRQTRSVGVANDDTTNGVTPLNSEQMTQFSSFSALSISSVNQNGVANPGNTTWVIYEGSAAPFLSTFSGENDQPVHTSNSSLIGTFTPPSQPRQSRQPSPPPSPLVPVVNPPSLSSDTSFVKPAPLTLASPLFSGFADVNTLAATAAGFDESNDPNDTEALGSSGMLFTQGNGVRLPATYYQPTLADPAQNP